MAVTKILARRGGLRDAIRYVMNGDKTEEQLLVATHLCTKENACQDMLNTKRKQERTGGVQYYHIVQSFKPGEVTPEVAMEIAQAFVQEHIPQYEAVIGIHTDRQHIHAHIIFNSVQWNARAKYHSNAQSYYSQIRAISDRLCREHGLSVIMRGDGEKSMSYIEWLKRSKGQPTYRSMLESDLKIAIEDANDIGHFYMLMEHMGYEIKHGNRLGFRLRGQEHFMYPERKNSRYSEDGIRAAIEGNLMEITAGQKPAVIYRPPYRPYKKHPKYKGFLALYVHYLYVLGKIQKQQYPPRMTAKMKQDAARFEQLREQFKFLNENGIETADQMDAFEAGLEEKLTALTKQRTILNVRKKKRQPLYKALADEASLAPAKGLYESGLLGMESEYEKYMEAVRTLNSQGVSREQIAEEKAEIYTKLADLNREIRRVRKALSMCRAIQQETPQIERNINEIDTKREVTKHDKQR